MDQAERAVREEIIAACRQMNALGLNQGTSGNISARFSDRMLITPSATPYAAMTPEMIAAMPFAGPEGRWEGHFARAWEGERGRNPLSVFHRAPERHTCPIIASGGSSGPPERGKRLTAPRGIAMSESPARCLVLGPYDAIRSSAGG